jgi:hypothetical protein
MAVPQEVALGIRRAGKELHGIVVSAGLMDKTVRVRLGGQRWEKRVHKVNFIAIASVLRRGIQDPTQCDPVWPYSIQLSSPFFPSPPRNTYIPLPWHIRIHIHTRRSLKSPSSHPKPKTKKQLSLQLQLQHTNETLLTCPFSPLNHSGLKNRGIS